MPLYSRTALSQEDIEKCVRNKFAMTHDACRNAERAMSTAATQEEKQQLKQLKTLGSGVPYLITFLLDLFLKGTTIKSKSILFYWTCSLKEPLENKSLYFSLPGYFKVQKLKTPSLVSLKISIL